MPLCFLFTPGGWWWTPAGLRAVPSCMWVLLWGTADVGSVSFLLAATPQTEASWGSGHQPDRENRPSLLLSHTIFIQTGIKAGGKLYRPSGGAPGKGLGDSYCNVSHTYYIRADQQHSNATQAQICPHRQRRG